MTKLTSDLDANLQLFIKNTQQTNTVWGLCNEEEGWLTCDSSEFAETDVMPFWSDEQDAAHHNVEEWADFSVKAIPLDVFIEEWLITLAEDEVLIGPNWNEHLEGRELEPAHLINLYLKITN